MLDNKLLTLEPSTAIPICPYCGCLIAKPCTTERESWRCPNNQIDYKTSLPDDFNPELN